MATPKLPKLPKLLARKIFKTGQTRGADDDEIYQNRVSRASTVLIPYGCWKLCAVPGRGELVYENEFIVLLKPTEYFGKRKIGMKLARDGLVLGKNALVFFKERKDWVANNPDKKHWRPARNRTGPLGGKYVARIAATTATKKGAKIIRGFNKTKRKGAGIRAYEYACKANIEKCRLQLEGLFWLCKNSTKVAVVNGMTNKDAAARRANILDQCQQHGLLNKSRLKRSRILNARDRTICPLCLEELSAQGFLKRMEQAEGRGVHDLTVTEVNLFHMAELRYGVLNHRPYNVGWGHHHCNVVARDSGIRKTLQWMRGVLNRNVKSGHFVAGNNAI